MLSKGSSSASFNLDNFGVTFFKIGMCRFEGNEVGKKKRGNCLMFVVFLYYKLEEERLVRYGLVFQELKGLRKENFQYCWKRRR